MSHQIHTGYFASASTAAGSALTWLYVAVESHAPTWQLVPPLLLSVASLITAFWSGAKMRQDLLIRRDKAAQDLRHADAAYQAWLESLPTVPPVPAPPVEPLDAR